MTKVQKPVSLFLVFALVFMLMACPLLQPKADAIAPAIPWAAAGSMELMAWLFGLLGISFSSKGDMAKASNQFLTDNPTISTGMNEVVSDGTYVNEVGNNLLKLSKQGLAYITDVVVPAVSNYFSRDNRAVSVKKEREYVFNKVKIFDIQNVQTLSYQALYEMAPYTIGDVCSITKNGVDLNYKLLIAGNTCYLYRNSSAVVYQNSSLGITGDSNFTFTYKMLFAVCRSGSTVFWVNPVMIAKAVNKTTGVVSYYFAGTFAERYQNSSGSIDINSLADLGVAYAPVTYSYDIDYFLSEILQALREIAGSISIPLDIPWDIPGEDVVEGKKEAEDEKQKAIPFVPDWAQVWQDLGIKDLIDHVTTPDPDTPYKPSVGNIPGIAGTWGYVSDFLGSALIWMQLWYSGFTALPVALKSTLWAVLVITIFTGLLGVFLR